VFILHTWRSSAGVSSSAEVSFLCHHRADLEIASINVKSRHCEAVFKCHMEEKISRSLKDLYYKK